MSAVWFVLRRFVDWVVSGKPRRELLSVGECGPVVWSGISVSVVMLGVVCCWS